MSVTSYLRAVDGNWKSFISWLMVTVVVCVRVSWLMKSAGLASTSPTVWAIIATSASTAMARKMRARGPMKSIAWPAMTATPSSTRNVAASPDAKKALMIALPRLVSTPTAFPEFAVPKMPLAMSGTAAPRMSGKEARRTWTTVTPICCESDWSSAPVTATPAARRMVGTPILRIRVRIEPSSDSGQNAWPPRPRLPK